MSATSDVLFRVDRGDPTPAELAALTVVLLARAAAAQVQPPVRHHPPARWHRPDRVPGHRGPRSWRRETRPGAVRATTPSQKGIHS